MDAMKGMQEALLHGNVLRCSDLHYNYTLKYEKDNKRYIIVCSSSYSDKIINKSFDFNTILKKWQKLASLRK